MKLALLGSDDEAMALVRAALDSGRYELVWAGELADRANAAQHLPEIDAAASGDWESLAGGLADLVVVAVDGDAPRRADQLRALVQAGVAACVTNCVALGPIVGYELDMNRVETEAPLVPYLPTRLHPAIARISRLVADDGTSQITFERGFATTQAKAVTEALARDVDVVRAMAGDVTRLSAAGVPQAAAAPDRDFSGLNVYLTTVLGKTIRWSVDRQLPAGQGRITIESPSSRVSLSMTDSVWFVTTRHSPTAPNEASAELSEEPFPAWNAPQAMLVPLESQLAGKPVAPTWLDAARAADVADMVEVSLRRSRTIDIYNESYNEQGTFKGLMGMAGCGLLLVALFTLFAAALGEKTARFLELEALAAVFGYWPYALLVVLVAFLLLQLLRYIVPPPREKRGEQSSGKQSEGGPDDSEAHRRPTRIEN